MGLVKQIGYLGFQVSDVASWEAFTTGVLGLVKSETTATGFNLRMDEYQQRFFVTQGDADDVTFIGFDVTDEASLMQLQHRLRQANVSVVAGSASDIASRGVSNLIRCVDPSGVPLEFYYGLARAERPFQSAVVADGFVAGDLGFGHVVVSCSDPAASEAFYLQTLGFKLSDTIVLAFGDREIRIVFTHINARHHSLAFAMPMPKKIHHFMVQAKSIDDVGEAYDRAQALGLQVTQQLGRHSNDRMFSFYAKTPSGFEFEFGADAVAIDDALWQPVEYDRGSLWGHRPPPPAAPEPVIASLPDRLPTGEFLQLDDGYRLHYHDEGSGAAVIFLHGSGQGASGWSNFKANASAFREQGYRTLMPDLLGFGFSSKPEDVAYTLDFHLAALEQFITRLGLVQVTLVGNSLGGALAIHYALHHPDRVANLILLAPGGIEAQAVYGQMPGLQAMFRVVMADAEVTPSDISEVLRLQLYDSSLLSDEVVAERYQVARTQPKVVWTTMQVPFLGDAIKQLRCPLLVFWGQDDQFLPVSGAEVMRQQCPHASVEVLPRCGHWVMVEHQEAFNRRCLAFLG
jgi:4,5:9,10-diseco-3-hydroxy-5,9,17-trioxoandrosta-1(10),2-diene-4-oate hydrolase